MDSNCKVSKYQRFMSLIGLMPYAGSKEQQSKQKMFSITVLLIVLGFAIYGPLAGVVHNTNDLMVSNSASALVFISQISALVIAQCEMLGKYEKYLEFNRCLHAVYEKFHRKTGYKICRGVFGAYLRRKYGYIGILACSSLIAFAVLSLLYSTYGFFWFALPTVIILRTRFLQISIYIDIILNYLHQLNNQLKQIVEIKKNKSRLFRNVECDVVESLQRLMTLKEIYNDIVHIVQLFNDIFGWALVSFIVCTFLGITVNLYWIFLSLDGFYGLHFFYCCFCTVFSLMLIWITFCYNCEKFQKSTKDLLRSLIENPNPDYNALLYEFLLQLTNSPLLIKAKGFFNGDMELLMKLITSIGSMMVILVQFSTAEFNRYNNT